MRKQKKKKKTQLYFFARYNSPKENLKNLKKIQKKRKISKKNT